MTTRILVIEDEEHILDLLRLYLGNENYEVLTAKDGMSGLELFKQEQPDFVILDIMLPRMDGMEVCQRIRQQSRIPILILTARDMEGDRVRGLELGADDYVTKPFSPKELLSRIRAILRRISYGQTQKSATDVLTFPDMEINLAARTVTVHGEEIEMTPREFELLCALAQEVGVVISREELLQRVWQYEWAGDTRTVDVHIGTLRRKIEHDAASPEYIHTVWGIGYRFTPPSRLKEG